MPSKPKVIPFPGRTALLALVAAALTAAYPAPGMAQVGVGSGEGCADPDRGSLGITGFRCDHCTFSRDRSGFTRAEFLTEPEVYGVRPESTEGDDLEVGDILVALEGALITTDAGARRLTSLRADEWVEVTVRRQGRTRDLRIRTARSCDVRVPTPDAPLPPTAGEPLRPSSAEGPPAPPMPTRRGRALPAPPSPPSLAPGASLGFGLECSRCSYQTRDGGETGAWSFDQPPRVYQVRQDGPAWSAGLRAGDVLEEIDGVALTSPEGGRLFARLSSGRPVTWTVRRGSQRLRVETIPVAPPEPSELVGSSPPGMPLRYTGSVGDADIEVRGGMVSVQEDRDGGVLVIRTGDAVVFVRRRAPGRRDGELDGGGS